MKIQRKSIPFYFLMITSLLILIGGTALLTSDPINASYILLSAAGLLLLTFGITETDKIFSKNLVTASAFLFGIAAIVFGYNYLLFGRIFTATFFMLAGCAIIAFSIALWAKKGE